MWVLGYNPFDCPENIVAVNLSQANCIYIESDTVYEDNGEKRPYWTVKVATTIFCEGSEEECKSVVYIADFTTPKEAQEYLSDLVKKLNGENTAEIEEVKEND